MTLRHEGEIVFIRPRFISETSEGISTKLGIGSLNQTCLANFI